MIVDTCRSAHPFPPRTSVPGTNTGRGATRVPEGAGRNLGRVRHAPLGTAGGAIPEYERAALEKMKELDRLKTEFNIQEPINLKNLINFRDIFTPPAETQLDADLLNAVGKMLHEALTILVNMRQDEGIVLFSDMQMRLQAIGEIMGDIRLRAPQVVLEYQKRLSERIKDLTAGLELDAVRLAQEVAVMADRCDITEEIVRMQSHIGQFEALLQSDEAEGRKIDFLLQEMNREINTIGSKGNDLEIARQVIEVKSELGKLREQAQNIE